MFTEGKYKILYIKKDDDYFPIGCLTGNSFKESADMLETTTRDNSDGWKSSIPTSQSYDISFNGIIFHGSSTKLITYREIISLKRSRTKIEWKIENGKSIDVDYGYGYITSLGDGADVGEYVSFSGAIVGFNKPLELECGLVTISDVAECDVFE